MKTDFKYGLKNASKFLKNFRHNVSENYEEEVEIEVDNINEQTFCDEPNQNNIQLSDILIKKHLQQTLSTYKKDLETLEENRENLIQAIEQISDKINGLGQLKCKAQLQQLQNKKDKVQVQQLIHEYHQLKYKLKKTQIQANQRFNKQKNKLKLLVQLCEPDTNYGTECQIWRQYEYWRIMNKITLQNQINVKQVRQKVLPKQREKQVSKKLVNKMKESTGLLGDLKMFAKNFKMPDT